MPAVPGETWEGAAVLIAAVDEPWRQDLGFGSRLLERLRSSGPPPGTWLEDLSFGTFPACHKLLDRPCRRAVLLCSTRRGREPGTIHRLRPPRELPPVAEIRARVADAGSGLVSVDNLVILGRVQGVLPDDVVLVEAEPVEEGWGDGLSPALAAALPEAEARVREEVMRPLDGADGDSEP